METNSELVKIFLEDGFRYFRCIVGEREGNGRTMGGKEQGDL